MNVLKIILKEDGGIEQFAPDFKIMRGSYRNVLLNITVPHSLLLDPVYDLDDETGQTGNNVKVGALIHTATGHNLQTQIYQFQKVKDYILNGMNYRLYQRRMPKEFTMWETVNLQEGGTSGVVELVINIINWIKDGENHKIEEVSASPIFELSIYPSAFLENEQIVEPTDFDALHSQVQDHANEIAQKVDKEEGKALSTNNYDNDEKQKVADNTTARHSHNNKAILDYTQESFLTTHKTKLEDNVYIKSETDILLSNKLNTSLKGTNNGLAELDENGKVPLSQINDSILGQVEYKGTWNAASNTPTLPSAPIEKGHYYKVSADGTQFGISFETGDWIISNGTNWEKVDQTEEQYIYEYSQLGNFPGTGVVGKWYLARDTGIIYRATGVPGGYVTISHLSIGETLNQAYRGDRGKIAYDHSQEKEEGQTYSNPHVSDEERDNLYNKTEIDNMFDELANALMEV